MKKRFFAAITFLFLALSMSAQIEQILGNWATVDDKTGNQYAIVRIYKGTDGKYYGKIEKMLVYPDAVCVACTGNDHNKPLQGLVFIRGFEYKDGQLVGGRCLDPESGKFYYGKIYLKDGHLVLRGSIDKAGLLGRNQTWNRAK